jgi:hypothetical protein
MAVADYFAQDYRDARAKFVGAARDSGASVETFENPVGPGPHGETLATDVVGFGDPAASRMLVLISATHGVEGFCGSGCQVGLIAQGVIAKPGNDTFILVVHAINPYGFAWLRRVNEDNIDLNRNSVDHQNPPPTSADYLHLIPYLVPREWHGPARDAAEKSIAEFIAARGTRAFQSAVTGGQYSEPRGLFYGGTKLTWSTLTLRSLATRYGANKARIAMIDFHTGLGPSGYGEPIYTGNDDGELARARRWYGDKVTSIYGGDSSSAIVQGPLMNGARGCTPKAEFTPLGLEYGTLPMEDVMEAMRAEQWLALYGDARSAQGRQIKQTMRDAFYVDTDRWKTDVFERAHELTLKALAGLAA